MSHWSLLNWESFSPERYYPIRDSICNNSGVRYLIQTSSVSTKSNGYARPSSNLLLRMFSDHIIILSRISYKQVSYNSVFPDVWRICQL